MINLAIIANRYANAMIEKYANQIRPEHLRVLDDIQLCHTQALGCIEYQCRDCKTLQQNYPSCGNRHCPRCQQHHNMKWLQHQQQRLLPTQYYLVTFTLPSQWRGLCYGYQKTVFNALFNSATDTLASFFNRDKQLGAQFDCCMVLHTHSRQLEFHPHVHCIVPALALDKSGQLVKQKRGRYLFNAQNLAKVFRAKMHQALTDAKFKVPRSPKSWIADCQHVEQGEKALIYLSRYLYRGVIAEKISSHSTSIPLLGNIKRVKRNSLFRAVITPLIFYGVLSNIPCQKGFAAAAIWGCCMVMPNSSSVVFNSG
ncbi:transposase zinc-binding domain-containing protein [Catenovulum adriaticum]|uniref:Transposase zinc-binding domain-containing protein n=1 Tax=Catenovulum adriaticum TaxID=2984846 RepID=A0ABY7ALQ7_9ALTE|nr:transposase zinc-binding domain-containing protein [Catenovulum sp. TS8]WAJ69601.1 transposase zinc-binding domain-containing protein [Catenovulum sp. TS8]